MIEETTLDAGSQEVAEPAVIATAAAEPVAAPQAPIAAEPASASISWLEGLPEDLRNEPSLRNFTDSATLAKSYVHAQRMIGADKVALPGKSATDDEWRNVYQKLGAPEDPNQYEFERAEVFDDATFESFKNTAYEIGLSNKQAKEVASHFEKQVTDGREVMAQRAEEARFGGEQELRQEFGQYFEQRLGQAQAAARTVMGDTAIFDEIKLADGRSLGDHPAIIRTFSRMAEMLGEDGLVGEPTEVVMSSQDAKQLISEHMRPNTPYTIAGHPEHDMAVAEVLRLRGYV